MSYNNEDYEFIEIHTIWGLEVRNTLPHYYCIWVPLWLDEDIVEVAESLGGKINRVTGMIRFESIEDITVFRLKAGV